MVVEKFILKVHRRDGSFVDVKLDTYPSKEVIRTAIINLQGVTASVDKIFEL